MVPRFLTVFPSRFLMANPTTRPMTRLVLYSLLLLFPVTASAAGEVGVRIGASLGGEGYNSQEIYWRIPLPGRLGEADGWNLTNQVELNAGRVSYSGDDMITAGGTYGVWLGNPRAPVTVGIGTGPTYISRTELGGRGFGTNWQFTSWGTVHLAVTDNIGLAYRIQHTSNAGFASPNQGFDLQALEVRVRF